MVLGWAVFGCGAPAAAQAQYRFDHWTADTGLPQNIITAIHQTRDGYLWIATLDGLARFDGVRFTIFDKSNSPGISSNRFTSLYEDRQGDLWLGTESNGVTRYRQGRFTTWATEHGFPPDQVLGFTDDEAGNLWVFSASWVRQWDPAREQFIEVAAPQFPGGYGRLSWNERGGFWGVDEAGLHRFDNGMWKVYALPAALRGLKNYFAVEAQDGTLWVEAPDGRLAQLKDGHPIKLFRTPEPHPSSPPRPELRAAYQDRQGRLWTMKVHRQLGRSLTLPASGRLEQVTFTVLFEDREGHLWLGTNGQGLYRVRKQIVTSYSQPQGLVGRNVYPIYEDRAGGVWIGAWDGGLSRFQDGKFTNYTVREGLLAGPLTALGEDREGHLWAASSGLQILRDGRFTAAPNFLPDGTGVVTAIHQDRAGALWFGTLRGLVRYQDGAATFLTARDGLASDNVRVIIEASTGGLWIGCYGGLTRLQNGRLTTWTERDGLPGNTVRALYEDREGTLWIGTYDSGLGRFRDGQFTRYTTRDGLFNDGVFQILEDGRGNLWMSCNRGIYRVRKQELNDFAAGNLEAISAIAYGKDDGMLNVECNGGIWPAGIKARDGKLWFPTQDGVAVIDPETIAINPQPPPVVIEAFLLDRVAVAFDGPVRIQPGQENVEIQYTALSFINSEKIRFKYRLEGLDNGWVDVGTRRTAYYSYVPPGSYTFRVMATNSDGVWNTEGASLRVVVLPPFYRTWWFLTLAALGVAGVIWSGYQYRVQQLKRAQAAQQAFARQLIEAQEAERQRIAAELHDSLGQNLLIIKNHALIGQLSAESEPEFQQQFDQIATSATQSIEEVRQIAQNLRPYHLDRLGLTDALEAMIEKVAAATTIRFVAELVPLDGLFSQEASITLYRVVQESLNNIVKHAQASEAHVRIERQTESVTFTIRDNGRGFSPKTAEARPGGFGLAGMAERVRILGGELILHSVPDQGTTVTIRLKLPGSPRGKRHGQ
jgi:signal transduction histidine kinase/ligand-binding sensor domain-containing protein